MPVGQSRGGMGLVYNGRRDGGRAGRSATGIERSGFEAALAADQPVVAFLGSRESSVRIVLQRVKHAAVNVDGRSVGEIGSGLLLLLGVHRTDRALEAEQLAQKCAELRVFEDETGKMNRSLQEIGGEALVVSQFTLYGDTRRGRRPSFSEAAPPDDARRLYELFVEKLRQRVARVRTGIFGAHMEVVLLNDGPVTLVLDCDAPDAASLK